LAFNCRANSVPFALRMMTSVSSTWISPSNCSLWRSASSLDSAAFLLHLGEFGISLDDRQQVVEVVSHAAGQAADDGVARLFQGKSRQNSP
jgi:hypothetical protein